MEHPTLANREVMENEEVHHEVETFACEGFQIPIEVRTALFEEGLRPNSERSKSKEPTLNIRNA